MKNILIIDKFFNLGAFLQKSSLNFNFIFSSPEKAIKKFVIYEPEIVFLYDNDEGRKQLEKIKKIKTEKTVKFVCFGFNPENKKNNEKYFRLPVFLGDESIKKLF
jgi:ribosome biogenesis protein Nip4